MIQTLVTGGTGFVGSAIVRALVNNCETVHVMTRNPSRVPANKRVAGAHYVQGDVLDPESLQKAMQGCDAIIHCVQFPGAPFENPKKGWTYENIDGLGTTNLCKAAQKEGIERVVYISGAGAGQGRKEPWFVAKDVAEKAVQSTGERWTIFRPSWIYGPGDQSLNKLILSTLMPLVFPIIGNGQQRVAPIYIQDMANAVVFGLNRKNFHKKTLEMGGPKTLTFNEMMHQMLEILGKKRIFVHIPARIAKLFAEFTNILPIDPFITADGIDFLCMDVNINVSHAHALFDFTFADFQKGLQKYL